jgi:hypothetical protein
MTNLHVKISTDGYHFVQAGIQFIEEKYGAKYMGYWAIKRKSGWSDEPVDVFYVENPDREKGHTNYFGMFRQDGMVYITNAESAFSETLKGIIGNNDEVVISRYRHDFRDTGDAFIDGGRDYTRLGGSTIPRTVDVLVEGSEFVVVE